MFRTALRSNAFFAPSRSFAGGSGAAPQKLGDKSHLETAIISSGQFLNTGNMMLGAFCKKHNKAPVALFADKSRTIYHEFSKDLYAHDAFKNETATGKSIFTAPKKGVYYRIESEVQSIDPENNKLTLQDKVFTYDSLIVASELNFDFSKVKGQEEALRDYWNSRVVSTAQVKFTANINRANREFRQGNFVVSFPKVPYKNEGTNHIVYWFDQLKQDRVIEAQWYGSKFIVTTPEDYLHRVPWVNEQLLSLLAARGIEVKYNLVLKEINYNLITAYHRIANAVFTNKANGTTEVIEYGMLATYPESSIPSVVSPLTDKTGLIDVDPYTLQHKKYSNVFALGECTNLPTINNSIANCAQCHVVAGNVYYQKVNMPLKYQYDGTSATPIFTGRGRLILPGFRYNWERVSTSLTTDTQSPLAGLKQSLSFKLFKRFEKKYFAKKCAGKIYGPPKWTKPSNAAPLQGHASHAK